MGHDSKSTIVAIISITDTRLSRCDYWHKIQDRGQVSTEVSRFSPRFSVNSRFKIQAQDLSSRFDSVLSVYWRFKIQFQCQLKIQDSVLVSTQLSRFSFQCQRKTQSSVQYISPKFRFKFSCEDSRFKFYFFEKNM